MLWGSLQERFIDEGCISIQGSKFNSTQSEDGLIPYRGCVVPHKQLDCIITLIPSVDKIIIWQMSNDVYCDEFLADDEAMVVGLGVISKLHVPVRDMTTPDTVTSGAHRSKLHSSVSPEESSFFSVGEDGYVRCWDEYVKSQRYSFKLRQTREVTVIHVIWSINMLATGHEDGTLCMWNIDSGAKVSSNALKGSAITAITDGRSKHLDEVLIVSNRSGKLGIWNLSLFKIHLLDLPLDTMLNGFHDPSDPGIMCLAYHQSSGVLFSGGSDGYIKMARLKVDSTPPGLDYHVGNAVWKLQVTENFLLSGDENGRCVAWMIQQNKQKTSYYDSSSQFPLEVTPLCMWNWAMQGSLQCISMEQEYKNNSTRLSTFIAITRNSHTSTVLWNIKVNLQSSSVIEEKNLSPRSSQQNSIQKWLQVIIPHHLESNSITSAEERKDEEANFDCEVFPMPRGIGVMDGVTQVVGEIRHEQVEPSCIELRICEDSVRKAYENRKGSRDSLVDSARHKDDHDHSQHSIQSANVFIGSTTGIIQKHKVNLHL